jgi:hypothetical protein
MQMILFLTEDAPSALLERPRKMIRSVVRHPAVMLIDRPAPRKPLPPRMPASLPEPRDEHEQEMERWDGGMY